jgi:hypothetical protein
VEPEQFAEMHAKLAEELSEVAFTPTGLAELFATGARRNFAEYGSLVPIVALHSKTQTVMVTVAADTPYMAERFGFLVGMFAGTVDPAYVTIVMEAWTKEFPADTKPERIRRGQLGEMAETGDETVRTALVSMTVTRDGSGLMIYDRVDPDGFDRTVNENPIGGVPDAVADGWRVGLEEGKPEFGLERLIEMAAMIGYITSGTIQTWDVESAS